MIKKNRILHSNIAVFKNVFYLKKKKVGVPYNMGLIYPLGSIRQARLLFPAIVNTLEWRHSGPSH